MPFMISGIVKNQSGELVLGAEVELGFWINRGAVKNVKVLTVNGRYQVAFDATSAPNVIQSAVMASVTLAGKDLRVPKFEIIPFLLAQDYPNIDILVNLPDPPLAPRIWGIVSASTGGPVRDVQVQLGFANSTGFSTTLTSPTDAEGKYSIPFDNTILPILLNGPRDISVVLRPVLQSNFPLEFAAPFEPLLGLELLEYRRDIVVKLPPPRPGEFSVEGRVTFATGQPFANQTVVAFDHDMRSIQLLAQATTDTDGKYRITYSAAQFARAEKASADLSVQAGGEKSPIRFNAEAHATIDLQLTAGIKGPSEYERNVQAIDPVIRGEGVALWLLLDADLNFLTQEAGIPVAQLDAIRLDAEWMRDAPKPVPVSTFYALLRFGLSRNQRELLKQSSQWREALKWAIDSNIVSLAPPIESILQALHSVIPPPDTPEVKAATLDLHTVRNETPASLAKSNPALSAKLRLKALESIRESLAKHTESSSFDVKHFVQTVDLTPLLRQGNSDEARAVVTNAVGRSNLSANARQEAFARISSWQGPQTVDAALAPDVKLHENALFGKDLAVADLWHAGDLARLSDTVVESLKHRDITLDTIDQEKLNGLVADGVLDTQQAKTFGFHADLYRFSGKDPALAKGFQQIAKPDAMRDLAFLTRAELEGVLNRIEYQPESWRTKEHHAAFLQKQAEFLYPEAAFQRQYYPSTDRAWVQALPQLMSLLPRNPAPFRRSVKFGNLDLTDIAEAGRPAVQEAYGVIRRFVDQHQGLELDELFAIPNMAVLQKVDEADRRLKLAPEFAERNQKTPFLSLNFGLGSQDPERLDLGWADAADQRRILGVVQGYALLNRVTNDAEHTTHLMQMGYGSATSILSDSRETFFHKSGLPPGIAAEYHKEATKRTRKTDGTLGAAVGLTAADRTKLRSVPTFSPFLHQLPGYSALFGDKNFCRCSHCQSIVSPAAYFVDLMQFIEKNITFHFPNVYVLFGVNERPLLLQTRRQDLWDRVQLTCESTSKLVPTLEIVNEILERFIVKPAGEEARVYRETLYERDQIESFRQPFLLPLERLNLYLSHFPIRREQVVSTILRDAPDDLKWIPQAILGISQSEYGLIAFDRSSEVLFLEKLYDLPDTGPAAIDAQKLLSRMGVNRKQLSELLETDFVNPILDVSNRRAIEIKAVVPEGESQPNREILTGCTYEALDRMHRFVRLWRCLSWSIPELDLVLRHIRIAKPSDNSQDLPKIVASLVAINNRFRLTVEELCALFSWIPVTPLTEGVPSMFDRLFNVPGLMSTGPWRPNQTDRTIRFERPAFTHPANMVAPSPFDRNRATGILQRLLAAFSTDDETLTFLIGDDPFELTLENVSRIYRELLLARKFGLSVRELRQLAALEGPAPTDTFEKLVDFYIPRFDQWKASGLTLDELAFVIGRNDLVQKKEDLPDPEKLAQSIHEDVRQGQMLVFADTIFSTAKGRTEAQSRQIVERNRNPYYLMVGSEIQLPAWITERLSPEEVTRVTVALAVWLADDTTRPRVVSAFALAGIGGLTDTDSREIVRYNTTTFRAEPQPTMQTAVPNSYRIATLADVGAIRLDAIQPPELRAAVQAAVMGQLDRLKLPVAPQFADTVFAEIPEVSADVSKLIVADNPAIFEPVLDEHRLWLNGNFRLDTPIIVPEAVPLTAQAAQDLISKIHASRVFLNRASTALHVPEDRLAAMFRLIRWNLDNEDKGFQLTKFLQSSLMPDELKTQLLEPVSRLMVLFRDPVFTSANVGYFATSAPGVFPIRDWAKLELSDVWTVSKYRSLLRRDSGATEASIRALQNALDGYQGPNPNLPDLWAAALGISKELAKSLDDIRIPRPPGALDTLAKIAECAKLAQFMGTGGHVLIQIASPNYDSLSQAADSVLATFRIKYKTEKEWSEKFGPFEDKLREKKRDALTDYLIHSYTEDGGRIRRFETPAHLYQYFLTDTEVSGCARTSRVVAGLSSLQLYVQRCLTGLEKLPPGDSGIPGDLSTVQVAGEAIDEWEWRKNYRVWEANRKVFLFCESYIEPDLRDNKTPQFQELETESLQQEINSQNLTDAYSSYLSSFEQIAKLKIAGSYHHVEPGKGIDVLHLFGYTTDEPAEYYYRTIRNLKTPEKGIVWGPWEKVNLQIVNHSHLVSPVVFKGRLHVFWVDYQTRPTQEQVNGTSTFSGYKHKMSLKFTTLRLDGTWAPPQAILVPNAEIDDSLADPEELSAFRAILTNKFRIEDDGSSTPISHISPTFPEALAIARELLRNNPAIYAGPTSVRIKPDQVTWNYVARNSTENRTAARAILTPRFDSRQDLHIEPEEGYTLSGPAWDRIYPDVDGDGLYITRNDPSNHEQPLGNKVDLFQRKADPPTSSALHSYWDSAHIGSVWRPASLAVNGSNGDLLWHDIAGDLFYVAGSRIYRVGTTLAPSMGRTLFEGGLDTLLRTQTSLGEGPIMPLLLLRPVSVMSVTGNVDWSGSLGVYFRELFFHIPSLIANYLNSQGKYADAQRWYHYIFDPIRNPGPGGSPWVYREFQEEDAKPGPPAGLWARMNNPNAIQVWEDDPFNPHAIARLQPGCYMRNIVMKYISNLIDWGDHLFAQDTTESINEATMLYAMAADLLGARPQELGDCHEETGTRTYENLLAQMEGEAPQTFMIGLETHKLVMPLASGATFTGNSVLPVSLIDEAAGRALSHPIVSGERVSTVPTVSDGPNRESSRGAETTHFDLIDFFIPMIFSTDFAKQATVFCIPPNSDLLAYWDRVEDRLYKIRHCMNISGVRRQLSLFSPEIDPRFLVRAKALGISIEDALDSLSGDLPPYRFRFLIEKAKEYAGALQGFGGALQSACERKDTEELQQLQAVQQVNILKLNAKLRDLEIAAAEANLEALDLRESTVTARRDHYQGLLQTGMIDLEHAQQATRVTAQSILGAAALLLPISGALALPPSIVGMAIELPTRGASTALDEIAYGLELISQGSAIAGDLLGNAAMHKRRQEEWTLSLEQANGELKEIQKQKAASQLQIEMATHSRKVHERSLEQANDIYEFHRDKFTNIGHYTWLSTTLKRVYRQAFQTCLSMSRMAERAYRFERSDETTKLLDGSYWDATHSGFLAGEQLMNDLRSMELRFLETNQRQMEIDQAFSLMQIAPDALLNLRTKGTCVFTVPELFFDLTYPGQYRRRIQSARLTIPCVTGPYTNVGATLTLLRSEIRRTTGEEPRAVPATRSTTIATSSARNDGGVFNLDFRDEHYMPFEGAGAVNSDWKLSLPTAFRPFDYGTISDVILHISYKADYDEAYREKIEAASTKLAEALTNMLKKEHQRVFNLRQEFPDAFHRLANGAGEAKITVTRAHFPWFMAGRDFSLSGELLNGDASKGGDAELSPAAFTGADSSVEVTLKPIRSNGDLKDACLRVEYKLPS